MQHKSIIFIYGPTGVGKSDYAVSLAETFPIEIVNCDVGQFYTPLSIGTAKPAWKKEKVPHHLFDVLNEPRDYTVVEYKKALLALWEEIWSRGAIPVVVGGSGFYIKSLFFPPSAESITVEDMKENFDGYATEDLWEQLQKYDPERAKTIHPHDRYRLERALTLVSLHTSITTLQPTYKDLGIPYLLICLSRERDKLYERINERTKKMIQEGWIEEVVDLQKSSWAPFLKRKKLIGYDVILNALAQTEEYQTITEIITQKTRHYAKRQMTFWRMLEKNLAPHTSAPSMVKELSITDTQESLDTYKNIVAEFLKNVEGKST
jgi:tRNA dimethylallyltransferase